MLVGILAQPVIIAFRDAKLVVADGRKYDRGCNWQLLAKGEAEMKGSGLLFFFVDNLSLS